MKQSFWKKDHNKFIEYFWIKEKPWKWDVLYTEKTQKYIKYIKWIPWLKMIGIWNSISMNCGSENSDIDLFIVTSPNSMWLNRILITFIFQILWVRKTSKKHKWRFCLSFFATTSWLNFWEFALKNDIYLYFWIVYFKPILNNDFTYELFIKKNEDWADFWEYISPLSISPQGREETTFYYTPFSPGGKGWDRGLIWNLNFILKKLFLSKTLRHFNKLWKPFWVIINNNMLKFHDRDIRKRIREKLI